MLYTQTQRIELADNYATSPLNNNPLKVIALMLNYLCCPCGELLSMLLPAGIQILHLYILISCHLPDSIQRQAAFLCFIRSIPSRYHRLYMTKSINPMLTIIIRFATPIMFAAMPTQRSRFAFSVSCKSFPT